jgi:hypothetical protein
MKGNKMACKRCGCDKIMGRGTVMTGMLAEDRCAQCGNILAEKEVPQRIQRKRTKGWRLPENTVCVSRPSKWGNLFKIDSYTPNREECIVAFEIKLKEERLENPEWFEEYYLKPIRGKNLACWCALGDACHADVWLELANN